MKRMIAGAVLTGKVVGQKVCSNSMSAQAAAIDEASALAKN